jgi:hypothetical protein
LYGSPSAAGDQPRRHRPPRRGGRRGRLRRPDATFFEPHRPDLTGRPAARRNSDHITGRPGDAAAQPRTRGGRGIRTPGRLPFNGFQDHLPAALVVAAQGMFLLLKPHFRANILAPLEPVKRRYIRLPVVQEWYGPLNNGVRRRIQEALELTSIRFEHASAVGPDFGSAEREEERGTRTGTRPGYRHGSSRRRGPVTLPGGPRRREPVSFDPARVSVCVPAHFIWRLRAPARAGQAEVGVRRPLDPPGTDPARSHGSRGQLPDAHGRLGHRHRRRVRCSWAWSPPRRSRPAPGTASWPTSSGAPVGPLSQQRGPLRRARLRPPPRPRRHRHDTTFTTGACAPSRYTT